jgi:hypothetical protein
VSRLFIELFLDEDVDVLVARLVRARGFRATTTQEAGQLGKSDAEQLAYAVQHGQTLSPIIDAISRRWPSSTRPRVGCITASS